MQFHALGRQHDGGDKKLQQAFRADSRHRIGKQRLVYAGGVRCRVGRVGRGCATDLPCKELLSPAKQQIDVRLRRLYFGGSNLFRQLGDLACQKGIRGLRRERQRNKLDSFVCKRRNHRELQRFHSHGGRKVFVQGQKGNKNGIRTSALRQQPPRPVKIRKHNGGRAVQRAGQNGHHQLSCGKLC